MKDYFVEGSGWFVVTTANADRARSIGVEEFGRGNVTVVRLATQKEVTEYIAQRGAAAMADSGLFLNRSCLRVKIVAFLQNLWVKDPVAVQRIFDRYGTPEMRESLLRRFLFYKSKTGKMLKFHLGSALTDQIVWEESTKQIGGQSFATFPPDFDHIKDVLRRHRPDIVLTFGNIARDAVFECGCQLLAEDRPPVFNFFAAPHPCARPAADPAGNLRRMRVWIERQL